jgi:hypothetical protein
MVAAVGLAAPLFVFGETWGIGPPQVTTVVGQPPGPTIQSRGSWSPFSALTLAFFGLVVAPVAAAVGFRYRRTWPGKVAAAGGLIVAGAIMMKFLDFYLSAMQGWSLAK